MWLIPGKTKIQTEIFKGVSFADILIGIVTGSIFACLLVSNLPNKFLISVGLFFIAALLIVRVGGEPNYILLLHMLRHIGAPRRYKRVVTDEELVEKYKTKESETKVEMIEEDAEFQHLPEKSKKKAKPKKKAKSEKKVKTVKKETTEKKVKKEHGNWKDMSALFGVSEIKEDLIHYKGQYYGAAIEIPPVEFRFFTSYRKRSSIENGVGRILKSVGANYATNIVKIERPILYHTYRENEVKKLEELRIVYEKGMMTEEELQARVEVIYDRIHELDALAKDAPVIAPFYYIVLFDSDKKQLNNQIRYAMDNLKQAELDPKRLDDKELAAFLKYSNQLDFNEQELDEIDPEDYASWILPNSVKTSVRSLQVNNIITYNMRVMSFPSTAGNCWMASMMSIPATKVVMKCKPMDRLKAIKSIDRSLIGLRAQLRTSGTDSKAIEIRNHIQSLSNLLVMLQNDNETLLSVNIYVTMYDIQATRNSPKIATQPPKSNRSVITNMKKQVWRLYQEQGMRLNKMDFEQLNMFIASQINGYDPYEKIGRGMPSNTISASYPWIFAHVQDKKGVKLGTSDGVPVFIDFFRRDNERVNSNMVIVGKSGSGKSYATKSLLANLAADDAKIFILDPENEYTELAENLHGKFINVGNAQYGRLNPFHIITSLDDDEGGSQTSGSYATHLQFLEEFFKQIIPDCEKDAMEYLNSLVDRTYTNSGITADTDLSRLRPEDYPIFDDLYDEILQEFQKTDSEYIRKMLRTLMNYIAKFSSGGRNASIWNGPSTITTDENFTVFNFQSLLANRNGTIANAQMLLVLKYIDNEIIKNREYNTRNNLSRKVVVVIDEAHVFIDEKYPVALDFMYQLAKRIRKYNGMQIVITQNIKDFVGTEEIARKSTAIINACQYSFIFALAPNDMADLCKLYEKAGGINESEQEQIIGASRGQAFTVMSPSSRTSFKIEVPKDVVKMFRSRGFVSKYFIGSTGAKYWDDFIGASRNRHQESLQARRAKDEPEVQINKKVKFVNFQEVTEDEAISQLQEALERKAKKSYVSVTRPVEELPDIPDIPDDPAEFEALLNKKKAAVSFEEVIEKPAAPVEKPVIQMVSTTSNHTEEMLAKFIGNFSYDVILQEIKRTVKEELLRETEETNRTSIPAASSAAPEPTAAQEPKHAEKEKMDIFSDTLFGDEQDIFADLFGTTESKPVQEEPAFNAEEEEDIFTALFGDGFDSKDEKHSSGEHETEEFNIFEFFEEQEAIEKNISIIEKMEIFGDMIIDITLEDLALYNRNMIQRG